jgi:hypothetical protein
LQKLCFVVPHTINDDIHKATFKYNFGGKDRIIDELCNWTKFWNISIIYYKFYYPIYIF